MEIPLAPRPAEAKEPLETGELALGGTSEVWTWGRWDNIEEEWGIDGMVVEDEVEDEGEELEWTLKR